MKKILISAVALAVLGAAAFATIRITVHGVCPLTGEPFCCPSQCGSGEAPAGTPAKSDP